MKDIKYQGGMISYEVCAKGLSLQVKDLSITRFSKGEEVVAKIAKEHLWIFPEA